MGYQLSHGLVCRVSAAWTGRPTCGLAASRPRLLGLTLGWELDSLRLRMSGLTEAKTGDLFTKWFDLVRPASSRCQGDLDGVANMLIWILRPIYGVVCILVGDPFRRIEAPAPFGCDDLGLRLPMGQFSVPTVTGSGDHSENAMTDRERLLVDSEGYLRLQLLPVLSDKHKRG
ncbi:unnamed protein product [Protopolystoma xenopodis]|uniref:Uncharacterized protein n=1 Tax=Protopolystoma xenopodis TaxID=117903 RepID=A0A448WER3_9PLAT|nr:unnamed protein product [Protopolystoma xenopodis]